MKKLFFSELDLMKDRRVRNAIMMPRTAMIHVSRHKQTGYLNAAPVSGGVTCLNPYQIIFGIKSWNSKETFQDIEEFCVSVPGRNQINHMWLTALAVPKGINEIDIAGWHEMPSKVIDTPGIRECPLTLECRKVLMRQLPRGHRAIVIGEVVGISIDTDILNLSRSEVIKRYPMHEATTNPKTGLYGPSILSGELIPSPEPSKPTAVGQKVHQKTHVGKGALYQPEGEDVLVNAIWPRPSYILMSIDEGGHANALPVSGGLLMHDMPSIQVPVPKGTFSYKNIKRTGEFVIAIPVRSSISNFEHMEENTPDGFEAAGFTPFSSEQMKTPGLEECPININCRKVLLEDIPGTEYAILVGRPVGLSVDKDLPLLAAENVKQTESLTRRASPALATRAMELYSQYLYAVMDKGMVRKWGFQDVKNLSVRPLPSWGSRWMGGWWFGYRDQISYWLIELVDEAYISPDEFFKIHGWLHGWHELFYSEHEEIRNELRARITKLINMMAWAHRSENKWNQVHEYLRNFPEDGFYKYTG